MARARRVAVEEAITKSMPCGLAHPMQFYLPVLILAVALLTRYGTDLAVAFLHVLRIMISRKPCFSSINSGYWAALFQVGLSAGATTSTVISSKREFHTLILRIDNFQNSWIGSRLSVPSGLYCSPTILVSIDRIKRSTINRPLRSLSKQYHLVHTVNIARLHPSIWISLTTVRIEGISGVSTLIGYRSGGKSLDDGSNRGRPRLRCIRDGGRLA